MQLEATEVVEHGRQSSSESLDPLLGQTAIAAARVEERPDGAVDEAHRRRDLVACLEWTLWLRDRDGVNGDGSRSGEIREEIDEVAALADQPAAAFLEVVQPVFGGQRARVDARQEHRRMDVGERVAEANGEWREASIEADHERTAGLERRLDLRQL